MMEFSAFLKEFQEETMSEAVANLVFVAEEAYEEAMQRKTFHKQTGALSSSIGWAVSRDGKILRTGGFRSSGREGGAGRSSGLALVRDVATGSRGICLILVAGMDYASYVEAKGFDVTTAGELLAEELVKWWLSPHA